MITATGLVGVHPTDYLQFFAPGNRESVLPDEPPPEKKAPGGGGAEAAQLSRRFMIYVHSKMMIVDDEVSASHERQVPVIDAVVLHDPRALQDDDRRRRGDADIPKAMARPA